MSLVAYGNSDDESDEEVGSPVVAHNGKTENPPKETTNGLSLPPPNKNAFVDVSLTRQKIRQPIRISIPALPTTDEVEEKPKLKPSAKGSGLFAILPQPKHQVREPKQTKLTQLVPQSLRKRPEPVKPVSVVKRKKMAEVEADEDDAEPVNSFFFLSDPVEPELKPFEIEPVHIPKVKPSAPVILIEPTVSGAAAPPPPPPPQAVAPTELTDSALALLCGTKDRRRSEITNLIELNGTDLIGDTSINLAKQLTEEETTHKTTDFNTTTKKRHQITYLADQAKANEILLRNQWANNRQSRMQTQAKYGF